MSKHFSIVLIASLLILSIPCIGWSQAAEEGKGEKKAEAKTIADPFIPADELELILTAYTKEELLVEAEGWQKVLREKAVEIGKAEIAVKRQNYEIEKAEEISEEAKEAKAQLEKVEIMAEQAQESGDAGVMEQAEEATVVASEKVSDVNKLVDEAVDAAENTAEVSSKMSEDTQAGIKSTVDAAKQAETVLDDVQKTVATVDLESSAEVKEAAGKVVEAAGEAKKATSEVEDKADKAVANLTADDEGSEPEKHSEKMQATEKLMEKLEGDKLAEKKNLLEQVNGLREERTIIIDNFNAVISALVKKTDQTDSGTMAKILDYQLYAKSVQGFHLDARDATSSWITIKGWLTSDEGGLRFALNILRFVAILFFAWLAAKFAVRMARRALGMTDKVSLLLEDFLCGAVRWVVLAIGAIMALSALEVSVTPLIALLGAAGFVIALALQDSLSNFASGIMILFFRPFDVGDYIDAGGISGQVTSMNLVSTTFTTVDNKKMVVPNNKIWQDVITNVTGVRTRRIDFLFGIGYEADIDLAKEVLKEIVTGHKHVLKSPEPNIRVHELADSSVNLICRPWVNSGDYWDTYWEVMETVKKRFDEEGISIPFPQQDVHLYMQKDEEPKQT